MLKAVRSTLLALGLVCVAVPSLAGTIVLEPWTTPFPPNLCLEDTHAAVIFAGPYCDGFSCPPGTIRFGPCNGSNSTEFSVLSSESFGTFTRYVDLQGETVSSGILPSAQRIDFRHGDIPVWLSVLDYQWSIPGGFNLPAHGVDELQFEVLGTPGIDPPISVTVILWGLTGQLTLTRSITQPGLVSLPLADFESVTGYTGTDVNEVSVEFSNCPNADCTGLPPATAGGFSLGPISFHSTLPTPTKQRSWSQVKSIYR
ncbi:MAG: hypothetical protein K8R56_04050 [Candidatus Eisenbacteria bacterium]|nr:hypothetical protein [Candidatus Eisenbacteria bacterium]